MFNTLGHPISEHLPFEARMRLVRASQAPGGHRDVAAAIDEATAWCRAFYPTFFQPLKVANETQTL